MDISSVAVVIINPQPPESTIAEMKAKSTTPQPRRHNQYFRLLLSRFIVTTFLLTRLEAFCVQLTYTELMPNYFQSTRGWCE